MSAKTQREDTILRLLASQAHIGASKINFAMKRYVTARTSNKTHVFNLQDTYQKIKLAAWLIASVDNPADVIVVSSKAFGQRAVLKFSQLVGTVSTSSSRWIPGTLTNQNTPKFRQPRLIIVTDPEADKQAVIEASYVNIPCIALCNTDSPLQYVDVAIPCNNRDTKSISMIYWLLARQILCLRGKLKRGDQLPVMVDLFFHNRDTQAPKVADKEEDENFDDKKANWDKGNDNEDLA